MTATQSQNLFSALPGVPLPVTELSSTLAHMWNAEDAEGSSPAEFRASQMNLIVHYGPDTEPEEAQGLFNAALTFAQKYPCRIIALCPNTEADSIESLEAKLFSQCYVGTGLREMCCCEAIILGFTEAEANFLDDQVSIWLESDLPTYHWLHRVPPESVKETHLGFLSNCTRILYDRSVENNQYDQIPWPDPDRVYDLAAARLLPTRQALGQYLSSMHPKALVHFLEKVTVRHVPAYYGEGINLLEWLEDCFAETQNRTGKKQTLDYAIESLPGESDNCLSVEWTYSNSFYFRWSHCPDTQRALIESNFGYGENRIPMQLTLLDEARALGEALFF